MDAPVFLTINRTLKDRATRPFIYSPRELYDCLHCHLQMASQRRKHWIISSSYLGRIKVWMPWIGKRNAAADEATFFLFHASQIDRLEQKASIRGYATKGSHRENPWLLTFDPCRVEAWIPAFAGMTTTNL